MRSENQTLSKSFKKNHSRRKKVYYLQIVCRVSTIKSDKGEGWLELTRVFRRWLCVTNWSRSGWFGTERISLKGKTLLEHVQLDRKSKQANSGSIWC